MAKALRTALMVILPLGGIIILTMTWLSPLSGFERVLNTSAGTVSIFLPFLGPMFIRSLLENEDTEQDAIRVESEDQKYPEIED